MNTRDLFKRLQRYGEIEWGRQSGGIGDDGVAAPPLIVWRYAEPHSMDFEQLLRDIVNAEDRQIDWLFDTAQRNWVLVPVRVMDEKKRHSFAVEAQAAGLLKKEDPDFCRRSAEDLGRIIAALDINSRELERLS